MDAQSLDTDKKVKSNDDEKFPTGQMVTLAICRFSEPIAFDSVIAYTYVMVQHLHNGDSTNASFYAGLLVSAYAFGEVLTAVIWGHISDRIGRKPIVLSGLVGVAISCLMFGFAQKYWVALLARLIGGMLNGNVAVMQTMLAEMIKNPKHEPTAYAIHPFVWYAGGILGSAMGGYLAQPAHYYPHIFSPDGLFGKYPYLLPNLVCVSAITIAVIQGAIFLKETNPVLVEKKKLKAMARSNRHDETTPLRTADYKNLDTRVTEMDSRNSSSCQKASLPQEEGRSSTIDPPFDLRRSSFGTMHSIKSQQPPTPPSPAEIQPPNLRKTFNFTVVMLIGSLVLVSYHSMGYFNLLPIYLLDKPNDPSNNHSSHSTIDLRGGLGYDIHAVGSFMAINGLIALVVQALIFPLFVRKFGVWKSYAIMLTLYPLTYPLIPLLTLLPSGSSHDNFGLRAAGIYVVMVIQNHLNIIIPPCALILLKNAVPSSRVLGIVNGACMSLMSASRTVAPPVEGIVYAKGGSAAAWASLMGVAVLGAGQFWWIPRGTERAWVEDGKGDVEAGEDGEEDRLLRRERGEEVVVED